MTNEYCCEQLKKKIEDPETPLYFWGSSLYCEGDWDKRPWAKTERFPYCPFCGSKVGTW